MPFYKLSKNTVLETFDDGGLVLILPERRLIELNPSAVDIIQRLDGHRTPDQVAAEISSKFGISVDEASQDVIKLCIDLSKSGILSLESEGQEKRT